MCIYFIHPQTCILVAMLRTASLQRTMLLRRGRGSHLLNPLASCTLSAHQILVLLSHAFHPQPCLRHQHTLSASSPSSSSLPSLSASTSSIPASSAQPVAPASARLHSSLATRSASSTAPLPLPSSSSSATSFVSLLDGVPLPSSPSAVRDLLDRLRPLLYLELSRLSSHPSPSIQPSSPSSSSGSFLLPTSASSAPSASATNDWLSAVDVDVICSHVLHILRAQHRSVTSREVVRLTVAAIKEQMRAADEVGRVVERIGAADLDGKRRKERPNDRKEPKFVLDKLRQQWEEKRERSRQQPHQAQAERGMQAIDRAEAEAEDAADSQTSETRILTVPLHRHHRAIFTTSPSTALHPSATQSAATYSSSLCAVNRPLHCPLPFDSLPAVQRAAAARDAGAE